MTAVKERCAACGDLVYAIDRGHPERCRGPRLRQPVYAPWDWQGLMADQDADDLRGTGGHDYSADDGSDIPPVGRH